MDSSVSPKLLNEKISSSACRTNFFSASEVRFWPELGDQIDLQMAPAVLSSQINPDRDKISQFSENIYFCDEPQIFSSHIISAATDSSNNRMRLEINPETELGNQIDFQMAPAVILSQINPDRDKISQFSGNSYFNAEPQIFSLRSVSAPTDSSNNPMKLELHQGTDSHNFPTHLAGANGRTDEIAYRDEFQSLSYTANLSAVDADALLNT